MEKLDGHFRSRDTATKVSNIGEIVFVRYKNVKNVPPRIIDLMEALWEQPNWIEAIIGEPM